ncbi:acyl-CoA dehydrogenase family protein [Nocardioides cheoyonin]|uniref:acyl-CoA dehydrogenase family protein n=1 Tax=Nocardioides cheoyonin TaxID=3156615 RepID=UPI0032B619F8
MTTQTATPTYDYEAVAEPFRPVFRRIAESSAARDQDRRLPYDEIAELKRLGIGRLRLPEEYGGVGLTLTDLFRLLLELGEADSNCPQILRAHYLFVEQQMLQPPSETRDRWLRLVGEGAIFGNATSERSNLQGRSDTTLTEKDGRLVLNGTKYYTTGSLFSDWINVQATYEDKPYQARVPVTAAGVDQRDDWDGFGQRTTGSGTIVFTDADVDRDGIEPAPEGRVIHSPIAQLVILTAMVGAGRGAAADVVDYVRKRKRSFSHANTALPKDDPQVKALVGDALSTLFAAESALFAAVGSLQRALPAIAAQDVSADALLEQAELDMSRAHVVIVDGVLTAITRLFDVGGASIVSDGLDLDRHWRNARTLSVHNPVIYKSRAVGDHAINGEGLIFRWKPGTRLE